MLTRNELTSVFVVSLVVAFSLGLKNNLETFIATFGAILLVTLVNIVFKKMVAYKLHVKIEHKILETKRYGWTAGSKFRNPISLGLILPILTTFLSFGYITWLNGLCFESKAEKYKAQRRKGYYMGITNPEEWHDGLIAISGVIANLLFAGVMLLVEVPMVAKLSVFYALFNIIPLGKSDGTKILFGLGMDSDTLESKFRSFIKIIVILATIAAAVLIR